MTSPIRPSLSRLGLALLVLALGWSWPESRAAAPSSCRPAVEATVGFGTVRPIATCDECRTSGRRAGYKQCCEQIGGDYVCQWVKC